MTTTLGRNSRNSVQKKFTVTKSNISALLFIQIVNLACLFTELSYWMLAIIVLSILWRALCLYQTKYKLSRSLLIFIALSGCVLLATTSLQLGLLLAMVHLLCFAYALKSFELNSRKDFYQIYLLGLFVLSASLIFQQSLYFSFLVVVIFVANISLLAWGFVSHMPYQKVFVDNGKLLLQSLPLAIVLFLFFPKLSPLWQVPVSASAKTGLSDTVTVGDVAELALSNELAFRVSFDDKAPAYHQLYWRTLVMENFDGKNWRSKPLPHKQISTSQPRTLFSTSGMSLIDQVISYQVIAPPSYQHWLFALDVAVSNANNVILLADYSLYSRKKISKNTSYRVNSYIGASMDKMLSSSIYQENLVTIPYANPKLIEEGKRLRIHYPDNEKLIAAVLQKFNVEEYRYTLKPPRLSSNALDEFYFETKAGFCEHYATTFTYLMRAAGIPARLVTGYLGGEYNPQGNYYSIYQRDAHAWAEVWLKDKGWQRIDPTAAVNPERVEKGFNESLQQEQSLLSDQFIDFYQLKQMSWLANINYQLDALDYKWTRWVVGYSLQKQFNLLNNLLSYWHQFKGSLFATFLFIILTLIIIGMYFYKKINRSSINSEWLFIYLRSLDLLAEKGIYKNDSTTAIVFCQQLTEEVVNKIKNRSHANAIIESFTALSQSFNQLQFTNTTLEQKREHVKSMKIQYKKLKSYVK